MPPTYYRLFDPMQLCAWVEGNCFYAPGGESTIESGVRWIALARLHGHD